MDWKNALWWLCFTVVGVWAQHFTPGVDFLVVGLVLSLQERRWAQTAWLCVFWLLLQEGAGSLAFGAGILWCAAAILIFMLGQWLFETRNIFFIILVGAWLGCCHYILVMTMAVLQDYDIAREALARESLVQALVIPPGWYLAHKLRFRGEADGVSA